ncbi:MAG: ATP-binding cassette domain-containing protein [Acidobacteria bacterium]|nr:ATP-binding cassette domain-containing protein [Acidobacteriota bacterium]
MLYRISGVRVRLGTEAILVSADFQQNPGEHLALVGRNGAGKTTLIRLLLGELEAEAGTVQRVRGLSMAHLPQHFTAPAGSTVLGYAMGAFARLAELERELDGVTAELADRPEDEELLERLTLLQASLESHDPYRAEAKALTTLAAFGIGGDLAERPVTELSGGQRIRLALARVLLEPADLLLLDEPTNHLDLFGAEALMELLRQHRGAFLVATHDRELIDRVASTVVEVANGRLHRWPGGYEKFRKAKHDAEEAAHRAWQRQQEHIRKTEEFIRRNLAGQKTKQAQARRKELEKLERVERPSSEDAAPVFIWGGVPRSGDLVLTAEGVSAGYGSPVLSGVDLALRRGERIAVIGPNGAGKTTLLRVLAGRMAPLAGRVVTGTGVVPGWYDQELADLPTSGTVLDALWTVHPRWSPTEVHRWAARFGFSQDDVEVGVQSLSGGEKGRLALARILASTPNLLFLDEPTNHLDLPTCEALEEALIGYPGALLIVSHDRRLLERLATRVLLVHGGRAIEVPDVAEALRRAGVVRTPKARGTVPASSRRRSPLAEEERRLRRDVESLRRRLSGLEEDIERRHRIIADAQETMADRAVWSDPERLKAVQAELDAARDGLDELEDLWAETAEDLDAFETRLESIRSELKG